MTASGVGTRMAVVTEPVGRGSRVSSRWTRGDERGSLTVELVLLTPAVFIVVVAIVAFGRISSSRQQVAEAARAGAEAAAIAPDAAAAPDAASSYAAAEVAGQGHTCVRPEVHTDVSRFYPGGSVTVTVICGVALSDLSVPGIPESTNITAMSTAPIDPYRPVG